MFPNQSGNIVSCMQIDQMFALFCQYRDIASTVDLSAHPSSHVLLSSEVGSTVQLRIHSSGESLIGIADSAPSES